MTPVYYLLNIIIFIIVSGYSVIKLFNISNILLFAWLWFNLFIAIYEIYIVYHRNKFNKVNCPTHYWKNTIKDTFWLDTWHEYTCNSDKRYLTPSSYVFHIELLNAILVILLWLCYIIHFVPGMLFLLIMQGYVCFIYFITLKNNILYHHTYKLLIYLFISSWWIIVPFYILSRMLTLP
jgi:hypothetical protein